MDGWAPELVSQGAILEAPIRADNSKNKKGPEPASVVEVKVPLKEACCEWVGPRIVFPSPISGAPIGCIKKGKHRQTDTQTQTHTDTHRQRHTDIQTYRHTDIHTDTHTHRHTCTQTHTQTHSDTVLSPSYWLTHTYTCTQTHKHYSYTCTQTHKHCSPHVGLRIQEWIE